MSHTKISLVVAISANNAIGKDNKLLWHIPEDMKRFRQITTGHPIIMGRKTFESIGKALPNRTNIIITRDLSYKAQDCIVTHSLDEAITEASKVENKEIFIIGGGQIFEQALPLANKLYLTLIKKDIPNADAFFPSYPNFNKILFEEDHEYERLGFKFLELEKG